MSEGQVFSEQESTTLGLRRAEAVTAGARLKALREAAGMHIGVLSATLKVPQSRLEALEADRLGDLPDATFARALAKAVCRVLKVESADILALLPASTEPGLERVSKGLNQPFKAQALGGEGISLAVLRKPLVLAPLGLLLAAAAVYLLPADLVSRWLGPSAASSSPASSAVSGAASGAESALEPQATPAGEAASTPAKVQEAPTVLAPVEQASAAAAAVASGPAPGLADAGRPVASTQAPQPTPAPLTATVPAGSPSLPVAAAASLATSGLSPLQLRASADSWVEVVDARGQVQYSRLMHAGEVADLQVQTPVKVRVGNVSGTRLSLRGEAVDLLSRARDNVARLELP